jgi:hypothetical protein
VLAIDHLAQKRVASPHVHLGLACRKLQSRPNPKKMALIPRGLQQFIKILCCQTAWSPRAYNADFLRNILPLSVLPPTLFSQLPFAIYGGAVIFAPRPCVEQRRHEGAKRAGGP